MISWNDNEILFFWSLALTWTDMNHAMNQFSFMKEKQKHGDGRLKINMHATKKKQKKKKREKKKLTIFQREWQDKKNWKPKHWPGLS